jgi:hypothetical protein
MKDGHTVVRDPSVATVQSSIVPVNHDARIDGPSSDTAAPYYSTGAWNHCSFNTTYSFSTAPYIFVVPLP